MMSQVSQFMLPTTYHKQLTQLLLHRLLGSCRIRCRNNILEVEVRASVIRHTGSMISAPLKS